MIPLTGFTDGPAMLSAVGETPLVLNTLLNTEGEFLVKGALDTLHQPELIGGV